LAALFSVRVTVQVQRQQAAVKAATAAVAAAAAAAATATPGAPSLVLPSEPLRLTIVQRQSKAIPGSNETLRISIGDITSGQALVTIASSDGSNVLDTTSLRESETADFTVNAARFQLRVEELRNLLTGDDFAILSIRSAGKPLSEPEKIDRLIQYVASLEGAKFIRNGEEHLPRAAADHLRRKRANAGGSIRTARQFIDELASKSSLSGEEYRVRLNDGKEISSKELLDGELNRLEGAPASTTRPAF
jgi:hypothetical protein